jgi:hypothetical protein
MKKKIGLNMSKRDFKITKKEGEWYNTEATDAYGVVHQNWFETAKEANDWIYYIWETEQPPLTKDEEMKSLANAIWGCHKLDKKLGLLRGNSDGLD